MHVTVHPLRQESLQKTGRCYLRKEIFSVTSVEKETVSGFNFLAYIKQISVQNQRNNAKNNGLTLQHVVDFEQTNALSVTFCFYQKKKNRDNTVERGYVNYSLRND